MLAILSIALLGTAAAAPPHTCESLSAVRLPQTTITSAVVVPAGPFTPPGAGRGRQGAAPDAVEPIPEHVIDQPRRSGRRRDDRVEPVSIHHRVDTLRPGHPLNGRHRLAVLLRVQ